MARFAIWCDARGNGWCCTVVGEDAFLHETRSGGGGGELVALPVVTVVVVFNANDTNQRDCVMSAMTIIRCQTFGVGGREAMLSVCEERRMRTTHRAPRTAHCSAVYETHT